VVTEKEEGCGVPSIEYVADSDPTLFQENMPYTAMDVPGTKAMLDWFSSILLIKFGQWLTAESKCKSVTGIRAAMCCIAIWIPRPKIKAKGPWDELGRVARPSTRVLNQGTVIIDNDSLPCERSLRSDFDDCIVYGCFGVSNCDCVPAVR